MKNILFSGNWKDNLNNKNVVYIITNNINNKIYVGIAANFKHRLYNYKYELKKYNSNSRAIICAIKKYGEQNFSFDYYQQHDSYENLLKSEISIIKEMKDKGFSLYNETNGGEGFIGLDYKSGCEIYNSKFKASDIAKIFYEYHENNKSSPEIAKMFNICSPSILLILKGKSYKKETVELLKKYPIIRKPNCYKNKHCGLNNYASKITKEIIEKIFYMYHIENKSSRFINNFFSISASHKILSGKSYKEESLEFIKKYPKLRSSTEHFDYFLQCGELNNKSKLKEIDVKNILTMFYLKKMKIKEIANALEFKYDLIHSIIKKKTWARVHKNFILEYDIQIKP